MCMCCAGVRAACGRRGRPGRCRRRRAEPARDAEGEVEGCHGAARWQCGQAEVAVRGPEDARPAGPPRRLTGAQRAAMLRSSRRDSPQPARGGAGVPSGRAAPAGLPGGSMRGAAGKAVSLAESQLTSYLTRMYDPSVARRRAAAPA